MAEKRLNQDLDATTMDDGQKKNLDSLPYELLHSILCLLSKSDLTTMASLVCHRFRDLCRDPSLRRDVRLSSTTWPPWP